MKKLIIACRAAAALASLSACSTSKPDTTIRTDTGPQSVLRPAVFTSETDLPRPPGPP